MKQKNLLGMIEQKRERKKEKKGRNKRYNKRLKSSSYSLTVLSLSFSVNKCQSFNIFSNFEQETSSLGKFGKIYICVCEIYHT